MGHHSQEHGSAPLNGKPGRAITTIALKRDPSNPERLLPPLRECPFCGAAPNYEIKRHFWDTGPAYEIWCNCLRASVTERSEGEALRQWNQRSLRLVSFSQSVKEAAVRKWRQRETARNRRIPTQD